MSLRFSTLWKWPAVLGSLAASLALAHLVHEAARNELKAESEETIRTPRRAMDRVVKLGTELAESYGIQEIPARAARWEKRIAVYGRVVPNPQATLEVRAPFAGTLRDAPDASWPTPGKEVRSGQLLGRIDIRVGSLERLDLRAKLSEAQRKQEGAEEVLRIQQGRLDRLRKLTGSAIVTQLELDAAQVAIADARTQAEIARASAELWQRALQTITRNRDRSETVWSEVLTAPHEGEVTELLGRPGMAVEAGTPIFRIVDFRRVLVRMDLPPAVLAAGVPAEIELTAAHNSETPFGEAAESPALRAVRLGPAPQVDAASQLAGYWYEIRSAKSKMWRPGLFVRAQVRSRAGRPVEAVAVPHSALLYHGGRYLVYVRIGPGRYERREVRLLGRDGPDWILADGVAAGDPVVSRQAQVLLSEEFKPEQDRD